MKVVFRIPSLLHLHQVAGIPSKILQEIEPERLIDIAALTAAQGDVGIVVIIRDHRDLHSFPTRRLRSRWSRIIDRNELQSHSHLVCRLLLEKKKNNRQE